MEKDNLEWKRLYRALKRILLFAANIFSRLEKGEKV